MYNSVALIVVVSYNMLRWYDYVVALVFADFLLAGVIYACTSEVWYESLIASFVTLTVYDMWNMYCQMRKNHESKR